MPQHRSSIAALIVALFTAAGATAAAPPEAEHVATLVRQLDARGFDERVTADRALRHMGVRVVPLLRRALEDKPPLEVRRRLENILEDVGQLHWHDDLDAALREAQQAGKPLLVFSSIGASDRFASVGARALQERTFSDLTVVEELPRHFVLYRHDRSGPGWEDWFREIYRQGNPETSLNDFIAKRLSHYSEGRGGGAAVTYFCTADGRVLYPLAGYWGPERYLSEANVAHKLARAAQSADAEPARYTVAERLRQLPIPAAIDARFQADAKPWDASLYPDAIWTRLLRPNLLPAIDRPIRPLLKELEGDMGLTH